MTEKQMLEVYDRVYDHIKDKTSRNDVSMAAAFMAMLIIQNAEGVE